MKDIIFDPEVFEIEDEIINHLLTSPMFESREPFFIRIFGLFLTRKYLTQKTIRRVTGLSVGKVSEEVNHLLEMGLIEKGKVSEKGKITYVASSAALMFLKFTKFALTNLMEWENELLDIKAHLDSNKDTLMHMKGYEKIRSINAFFLELISAYKKQYDKVNKTIQSFE
jgi:DNA-binding transcriptional regulator GbsR (MarR family)